MFKILAKDLLGRYAATQTSREPAALADRTRGRNNIRRRAVVLGIAIAVALAGVLVPTLLSSASPPRTPSLATLINEGERPLSLAETPVPGWASGVLGFGDADGGRPIFPYTDVTNTSNTPVFDSMVDTPEVADERLFLQYESRTRTKKGFIYATYSAGDVSGVPGPLLLWLYIDNNAAAQPNCAIPVGSSVAQNTRVRLAVWDSTNRAIHVIRAWLEANNAHPRWVTDAVAIVTQPGVRLQLDPSHSHIYSPASPEYSKKLHLANDDILDPAGMQLGPNGVVGSCWSDRFYLVLSFDQR